MRNWPASSISETSPGRTKIGHGRRCRRSSPDSEVAHRQQPPPPRISGGSATELLTVDEFARPCVLTFRALTENIPPAFFGHRHVDREPRRELEMGYGRPIASAVLSAALW